MNKIVRQEWQRFAIEHPELKDLEIAEAVQKNINRRKIQYQNRKMSSMARQDVTKRTVRRFIMDKERKETGDFWSLVRVNPTMIKFKYKLGDKVRLFTKLTDVTNPAVKRSERSLLPQVYEIIKRGAYLRGGFVCPYYLVKPEGQAYGESKAYVVYPESIQRVKKNVII